MAGARSQQFVGGGWISCSKRGARIGPISLSEREGRWFGSRGWKGLTVRYNGGDREFVWWKYI